MNELKTKEKFIQRRQKTALDMGNIVFGRLPPQSIDLEVAILGAILLEKNAFDTAADILTANSFYSDAHQRIFEAMKSLANKNMPIDLLTVVEELQKSEEIDLVGGPYYISKLTNGVVSSANLEVHCRIVLQKFISREVIRVAGELIQDAYSPETDSFDLLDMAEEKILQIGSNNLNGDMIEISTVLMDAIKKIDEWRQNDGTLTGIPTGFSELDKLTRGWQNGDLIILGARPSTGKTALALNIVRNAALNDVKRTCVAVWSLEMKAVYLALRMMAAESEIYLHKLQTGRLSENEMKTLINKGVNKLRLAKIFFDENTNINLRTLRSKCRKLKKKNKLGLVVIDYLQLMGSEDGKGNREQEIAKISRGLKNLAQELDIPIIALSQLSRDAAKGITWSNGPGLSSLRESGAIEQDADMVIMLWGPSEEEITSDAGMDGKRRIKIVKQRNGMLGTIDLDFKNEIQLFEAIDGVLPSNFKPVSSIDFTQAKVSYNQEDENPF